MDNKYKTLSESDLEVILNHKLKKLKKKAPEESREYQPPQPSETQEYEPMDFETPLELLYFLDDNVAKGLVTPYAWQKEELLRLGQKGIWTKDNPLKYCLQAANGSGKDAFVISIICLFKLLCRVRSRTVVTSSSTTQLKLQTEAYIKKYVEKFNTKMLAMGFPKNLIQSRRFPVTQISSPVHRDSEGKLIFGTGSEIVLFTTDETGRAEGWHPFPDYPKGEVTLIINESKTVEDFIFDAFGRCTYTFFIQVSSPGKTSGRFYFNCQRAVYYPAKPVDGEYYARKVTSYECPAHISKQKIESDKQEWGENSFLFRSRHLAEFTSLNEQVVVSEQSIKDCIAAQKRGEIPKIEVGLGVHGGIDLAFGGGDEVIITLYDENIFLAQDSFFPPTNPLELIEIIDMRLSLFEKVGLSRKSLLNVDDGNVGSAIIAGLELKGWNVCKVLNQSQAINRLVFLNRGAELYFNCGRLIQEKLITLNEEDKELHYQLQNRYYDNVGHQGKLFLEDKKKAKKRLNGKSPDRADSLVLAFAGYRVDDFKKGKVIGMLASRGIITMEGIATKQQQLPERFRLLFDKQRTELRSNHPGNILRSLYHGSNKSKY